VAAAPLATVQPEIGPPGTRFLFFAAGFKPYERVSIWLNAPDGRVQPTSAPDLKLANSAGEAIWTWTAPDDMTAGGWQMVVHGLQTSFEQVISFTIGQPPAPPEQPQPFGVDPPEGPAGTLFRFFATGFRHGEFIDASARGPGGVAAENPVAILARPGVEGRVDGSWLSTVDAAPGAWQIILHGSTSDVTRTIPVVIHPAAPTPPAQLTIRPPQGTRGTRFIASVTGFQRDEKISVWLNLPDGRVQVANIEGLAKAGPDGHAAWGWIAPDDAPLGDWQMVAHGRESGIEVVAGLTIR
jgi:hypothetical protein